MGPVSCKKIGYSQGKNFEEIRKNHWISNNLNSIPRNLAYMQLWLTMHAMTKNPIFSIWNILPILNFFWTFLTRLTANLFAVKRVKNAGYWDSSNTYKFLRFIDIRFAISKKIKKIELSFDLSSYILNFKLKSNKNASISPEFEPWIRAEGRIFEKIVHFHFRVNGRGL